MESTAISSSSATAPSLGTVRGGFGPPRRAAVDRRRMYVYLPTWRHRGTRGSRGPPSRLAAASRGGSNAADDDQEPEFDIDDLAKRLSFEAARLRSSLDGDDAEALNLSESSKKAWDSFGRTAKELDAKFLGDAGSGGFEAFEFELFRPLGQIQVQQRLELERSSPLASTSYEEGPQRTAVLLYTARYYSGMPFQDPVTVLIKEYLPECRSAAYAELEAMRRLLDGLPEEKWSAAVQPVGDGPPVVQLLGYYLADPSLAAAERAAAEGQAGNSQNLWMVSKWDALRPLSLYPGAEQSKPFSMFGFARGAASSSEARAQVAYLRALFRGCIEALAFCHSRGVSHGSLGGSCVMLSTLDNREADDLEVKLDNFGLAKVTELDGVQSGALDFRIDGEVDDCFSLGVLLLELVFEVLGEENKHGMTKAQGAVQRLLVDVFEYDMDGFRGYCEEEGGLARAVDFLSQDGGAGWYLLGGLVNGERVASLLSAEPSKKFLDVATN